MSRIDGYRRAKDDKSVSGSGAGHDTELRPAKLMTALALVSLSYIISSSVHNPPVCHPNCREGLWGKPRDLPIAVMQACVDLEGGLSVL